MMLTALHDQLLLMTRICSKTFVILRKFIFTKCLIESRVCYKCRLKRERIIL